MGILVFCGFLLNSCQYSNRVFIFEIINFSSFDCGFSFFRVFV